jgi:hypothetical protein
MELQMFYYRQISEFHYLQSLLFYYKIDEDIGGTFYDSSIYQNNVAITLPTNSAVDNWAYWD